jgi:hypothetical protein
VRRRRWVADVMEVGGGSGWISVPRGTSSPMGGGRGGSSVPSDTGRVGFVKQGSRRPSMVRPARGGHNDPWSREKENKRGFELGTTSEGARTLGSTAQGGKRCEATALGPGGSR